MQTHPWGLDGLNIALNIYISTQYVLSQSVSRSTSQYDTKPNTVCPIKYIFRWILRKIILQMQCKEVLYYAELTQQVKPYIALYRCHDTIRVLSILQNTILQIIYTEHSPNLYFLVNLWQKLHTDI